MQRTKALTLIQQNLTKDRLEFGVPFSGHIICGHNPYLFARLVDNLVYDGDEFEDNERLVTWDDRVVPENKLF